tara:strand:- start:6330 stop:7412 length:1083 start_codon:yes stop_codon:yes gene_type:complete
MSDMREALNAALDANAEGDDTQNYDETPQEVELASEETTETETSEEESSSFDTSAETPKPPSESDKPDITASNEGTDKSQTVTNTGDSIKAPIDWGPQDREAWSKIPRHLQEKVMSREKELNTMLQTTTDARKTHTEFNDLSNKYGSVLSGIVGDTPMEAVGNLFNTVANLRMGTQNEKAQIISGLINDFGVDINTLDNTLVGSAPSQSDQQNSELETIISNRLAPFEEMLGQQNAYRQQQETQQQESANNEVQQFSKNAEFLSDVRHDMADFIDMASNRGQPMTIQEAYNKACALNPQIQSVLQQRAQQDKFKGNNTTMANKRLAASSITGSKGGVGGGNNGGSMRDTIAAAWDGADKF